MGLENTDHNEAPVDASQGKPEEGMTGAEAAEGLPPEARVALEESLMSTPEGQAMLSARDQLASLERSPKSPLELVLSGEVAGLEIDEVENVVSRIIGDMRFKDQLGHLAPAIKKLADSGKKVESLFQNPLLAIALPELFEQYAGKMLANPSEASSFKQYWKSVDRVQGEKGVVALAEAALSKMRTIDLGEMLGDDFFRQRYPKLAQQFFDQWANSLVSPEGKVDGLGLKAALEMSWPEKNFGREWKQILEKAGQDDVGRIILTEHRLSGKVAGQPESWADSLIMVRDLSQGHPSYALQLLRKMQERPDISPAEQSHVRDLMVRAKADYAAQVMGDMLTAFEQAGSRRGVKISGDSDSGFKMSYMSPRGDLMNFPIQIMEERMIGNGAKIVPMFIQVVVPSSDPEQPAVAMDLASAVFRIREASV